MPGSNTGAEVVNVIEAPCGPAADGCSVMSWGAMR